MTKPRKPLRAIVSRRVNAEGTRQEIWLECGHLLSRTLREVPQEQSRAACGGYDGKGVCTWKPGEGRQ